MNHMSVSASKHDYFFLFYNQSNNIFVILSIGCFNNYACSSSIDAECTEYEPCRLYFETYQSDVDKQSSSKPLDTSSEGGLGNNNSESSSTNSDTVELEVFKIICSESDIEQNKNICKDKCIPYECCFNTDNSCSKQKDCKNHEICEGFFVRFDEDGNEVFAGSDDIGPSVSSPSPPPPSPAVDYSPFDDEEILVLTKACSLTQIHQDNTQCKMLCRGSECKYTFAHLIRIIDHVHVYLTSFFILLQVALVRLPLVLIQRNSFVMTTHPVLVCSLDRTVKDNIMNM